MLIVLSITKLSACSAVGDTAKSMMNPGYNIWAVEINSKSESQNRDILSFVSSDLIDLGFGVDSFDSKNLETEYMSGHSNQVDEGNILDIVRPTNSDEIKIRVKIVEDDDTNKIQFVTNTKRAGSSFGNRRSSRNPGWSGWMPELLYITERVNAEYGVEKDRELGRHFISSGGHR